MNRVRHGVLANRPPDPHEPDKMLLPSREVQERLRKVKAEVDALKRLQAETSVRQIRKEARH
jgi:hypothetical protein